MSDMKDRGKLIQTFNESSQKHGLAGPEAVQWGTRKTQYFRFKILCDMDTIGESDATILDWGCGTGDLYDYLCFQGFRGKYIGVDINPAFIDEAKKKYGRDTRTVFEVVTRAEDAARFKYDYCVSSGVFNINLPSTEEELKLNLRETFAQASRGVAFNGISIFAKQRQDDLLHLDPFELGAWCMKEVTPFVTVRHDYRGGNFTLYLYKGAGVDF